MEDLNSLWEEVKKKMYLEMANVHFNTWINPIKPIKKDGNTIYLNSTIKLIKRIVNEKYLDSIQNHFIELLGFHVNVILLEPNDEMYEQIISSNESIEDESIENNTQMEFNTIEPSSVPPKKKKIKESIGQQSTRSSLNPKYVFENFVRGKSNDFALAVAMGVSENPGTKFNPFFIYGGSGLGKTHLMQAIGHEILKNSPETKVLYITSENFMNEFISTITDNKNSVSNSKLFRNKYRNSDVLMIDDIQFIAGKEGTQEEIFHTFNSLREAKKQIILTSDKMPSEIENLEQRLVTRFSGGIVADIQQPDFETRVAILNHKIRMDRLNNIPNNVIEFVAENITSNIRQLEGAIINVDAHRQIVYGNDPISDEQFLELAKKALSIKEKENKPITLELIKDVVTDYYHLQKGDLVSRNRKKNIAVPRQVAMYISRQLTSFSVVKIGNSFNRDHSTIVHGDEKIESLRKEDSSLNKDIEKIIARIKNS